jgi:hypothetical protein
MRAVRLWIAATIYFSALFCWQNHYITALGLGFRFPTYRSIQVNPSFD